MDEELKKSLNTLDCPDSVTWTNQVKGLFNQTDINCMNKQGLDLTSYSQVKSNAAVIYKKVSSGAMPLNQPRWSTTMVSTFGCWMQQGCPE